MRFWLALVLLTCSLPENLCAQGDKEEVEKIRKGIKDAFSKSPFNDRDWDDKHETFFAGEKVQLQWGLETVEAEVVEQDDLGWVKVKFMSKGEEVTPKFPADRLTRSVIAKAKERAKTRSSGKRGAREKAKNDVKLAAEPEQIRFRLWADKSGKFQIKAKFVEIKDDKVRLEQENGKTISIALDELSDVDRKLAEKLAKGDEPEPAPKKKPEAGGDDPVQVEDKVLDIEPQEVSWSFTETIEPKVTPEWKVEPDGPLEGTKKLSPRAVKLYSSVKSKDFHESAFWLSVDTVLFARDRGLLCIASIDKRESLFDPSTILQRVELDKGKVLETVAIPGEWQALAMDPAGRRVITSAGSWHSEISPRLSLWEFGSGNAKHIATWSARPLNETNDDPPNVGMMLDVSSALTIASYGTLVKWKLGESPSPEWRMQLSHGCQPALSPGRNQLAVAMKNRVFLLDPKSGETLGSLPYETGGSPTLAFSPDGKRLAAVSSYAITVWNLETGELYRELPVETRSTEFIDWVSDKHLLVGGSFHGDLLYDIEKRVAVWEYKNTETRWGKRAYGEMGGVFWYVLTSQDSKERGVFGVVLPHDEAKAAANFINTDDLLVLKKGTPVSITVVTQGTEEQNQKIKQSLTTKLKNMGLDVVETAPLNFWAKTEVGPTETLTYAPWNSNGDKSKHQQVNVTGFKASLELHEGPAILWQSVSYSGGGGMLLAKEGESLQAAANQWNKPNYGFFETVKIPRDILRGVQATAAGASEFTHRGLEPAQLSPQASNTAVPAPGPGVSPDPQPNAGPRRNGRPRRDLSPKINVMPKLNPEPKQNLVQDPKPAPKNNARPVVDAPPTPAVEAEPDAEQKSTNDRPIRKRR